jgi:Urocanase Rossmann-like domain
MIFHSPLPVAFDFILEVECLYAGLISAAARAPDSSLGGSLVYAGALGAEGRALAAAANIAGAASLAVIPGAAAQKQAVREGVVDFLITGLDEALRILKNQLRKREPVAVCVAASLEAVEDEMFARGVLPDLLGPGVSDTAASRWPASRVVPAVLQEGQMLVAWSVAAAPAVWLPRMDTLAAACLPADAAAARRWLRMAPRYTGRLAQGVRLLRCSHTAAEFLQARVSAAGDLRDHVDLQLCQPAPVI